MNNLLNVF